MSDQQNTPNKPNHTPPVDEKLLAQMIEAQILKTKNESRELDIRSREVDHQAEYANNYLKVQAELLKNKPSENRKTMTRMAYIIGGFVLMFILLIVACLFLNKDVFLITLLKGVGYVITTLGGYWAGTKNKGDKKEINSPDSTSEIEQ